MEHSLFVIEPAQILPLRETAGFLKNDFFLTLSNSELFIQLKVACGWVRAVAWGGSGLEFQPALATAWPGDPLTSSLLGGYEDERPNTRGGIL